MIGEQEIECVSVNEREMRIKNTECLLCICRKRMALVCVIAPEEMEERKVAPELERKDGNDRQSH